MDRSSLWSCTTTIISITTAYIPQHIYYWVSNNEKALNNSYNIDLTYELFTKYIHGNSDNKVVQMLIPNANLQIVSDLKDKLFIESIYNIKIIDKYIKNVNTKQTV